MRRRLMVIVAAFGILALLAVPTALAGGGPAQRATGSVYLELTEPDGDVRYVEFDAHEATDRRPAKGHLYWLQIRDGVEYVHKVSIDSVEVAGDCATFSGTAYEGPRTGKVLSVGICDSGTPGADGDTMMAQWQDQPAAYNYTVVGGNLVVHAYD